MRASDISRGRQILARFLALAEERLAYLTELYDSGRWTRYFTQTQLLENVRDARQAVDAWKLLVSTEALPNNRPVNLDWLDSSRPLPPRKPLMIHDDRARPSALPAAMAPTPAMLQTPLPPMLPSLDRIDFRNGLAPIKLKTLSPMPAPVAAAEAKPATPTATPKPKPVPVTPKPAIWQNSLDFALMRERYPLLRQTG